MFRVRVQDQGQSSQSQGHRTESRLECRVRVLSTGSIFMYYSTFSLVRKLYKILHTTLCQVTQLLQSCLIKQLRNLRDSGETLGSFAYKTNRNLGSGWKHWLFSQKRQKRWRMVWASETPAEILLWSHLRVFKEHMALDKWAKLIYLFGLNEMAFSSIQCSSTLWMDLFSYSAVQFTLSQGFCYQLASKQFQETFCKIHSILK